MKHTMIDENNFNIDEIHVFLTNLFTKKVLFPIEE